VLRKLLSYRVKCNFIRIATSTVLPQQFDSRLQRFFHVVHPRLNVGVGQLTKPRNYFSFSSSIVTRINLCRYTDAFTTTFYGVLPRCMECLRGLHMRIYENENTCLSIRPSVCPSVCLSIAWFVTKRKKVVSTFLYHMQDHSP